MYKIKIKNNFIKGSTCTFPVSIGNIKFENSFLVSQLNYIKQNFSKCNIIICDTLQRHNLSLDEKIKNPIFQSKINGDIWIKNYSSCLSEFNITRWDFYLDSEHFESQQNYIYKLYSNDTEFKKMVDDDVQKYCNTYLKHKNINEYLLKEKCTTYILEECAIINLFEKTDYILYHRKLPKSCGYIQEINMFKFLEISIK